MDDWFVIYAVSTVLAVIGTMYNPEQMSVIKQNIERGREKRIAAGKKVTVTKDSRIEVISILLISLIPVLNTWQAVIGTANLLGQICAKKE